MSIEETIKKISFFNNLTDEQIDLIASEYFAFNSNLKRNKKKVLQLYSERMRTVGWLLH